jgi:hypothetical protein
MQGCLSSEGSRLQMRTVVSSEAEAIRYGFVGQVARSLISYLAVSSSLIWVVCFSDSQLHGLLVSKDEGQ